MKDALIIGFVGLLWELMLSDSPQLISVVLFALLMVSGGARFARARDILVICLVGLLWATVFADSRRWVTIVLFGLLLLRLLLDALATQQGTGSGAPWRMDWNSVSPRQLRLQLYNGLIRLGSRIRTREFITELVANLGMLTLGVSVAIYLTKGMGVSRQIIGYGALSFALGAVGFKGILYAGLVVPVLHKRLAPSWLAITQGVLSALSELGAAALFFLLVVPELSIRELIAFGAAAGIVEAVVIPLMSLGGIGVLSGTPVESSFTEEWKETGATPLAVMVFPLVERALTMWLHISSRALVYAAMVLGTVVPAVLSVLFFASVDGLGYYALLKKWKVLSFTVAVKFYAFVALAAGLLTLVFWRLHASL